MTIFRPNVYDLINDSYHRLKIIEQGCPPFFIPGSSQFLNGADHAFNTFSQYTKLWGFRVCDGGLEHQGYLLVPTLDVVVYVYPLDYLAFLDGIEFHPSVIIDAAGASHLCNLQIDVNTGELTVAAIT